MRKVIYYVASSLDGFIAHADHSVGGFVAEGPMVQEYLDALQSDFDTVIMGRRTYEFGLQFGVTSPYPWLKQYVVSRSMTASPDPAVELVQDDGAALVRQLKAAPGGNIYLCGGGQLAGTLLKAGLLDEVIIKLNPFLIGNGVGLFGGLSSTEWLELHSVKEFPGGGVKLHYRVRA